MKLKNKIVALALVVASAFGLAVSNRATKVEAADFGATLPSTDSLVATFELGDDGDATHADGSSKSSYSETIGDYTLTLSSMTNVYTGARDATGNGALKFGTGSKAGSMTVKVPDGINYVAIYAAKYKTNTSKVTVAGATYTLASASNDGLYDKIVVDTKTSKTFTFVTVSGGLRCMVNTIEYYTVTNQEPSEVIKSKETKVQLGLVASSLQTSQVPAYDMVKDVADLEDGDQIIIGAYSATNHYALGPSRGNNHSSAVVNRTGDSIYDCAEDTIILTLGINEDGKYTLHTGEGYLTAASSSSNHLKIVSEATELDAQWAITIAETGKATIQAQGEFTRNTIRFNTSNDPKLFSCYAASNSMLDVAIYKDYGNTLEGAAEYTYFSDVKLRFVAEIPEEVAAAIDADGEFGINIIGETKQQDIVLESKYWIVDTETNDVSFAVVVNVPADKYNVEVTGQAYVTIDGVRVDFLAKTFSVSSLVDHYLENQVVTDETEVAILEGFQKFIAENA